MNPLVDKSEYDISAFEEWKWLAGEDSTPLFLTAFGDWIFSDVKAICLCSPTAFESYQIATVIEEIDWAFEDIDERAPWVYPALLRELEESGNNRVSSKVFHFVRPLFLGGSPTVSNVQQLDIHQYFQGMQKLLQQVR